MSFVPSYVLWNSSDTAIIYTIPMVSRDSSPQDPFKYVELESLRGQGSIIVPGSDYAAWDLELDFHLFESNYENLIAKMDAVESTIIKNTKYILKIGRTSTTTKSYKVKRLVPIVWDDTTNRVSLQKGTIILRVNSWN